MYRFLLPAILTTVLAAPGAFAQPGQLDASPTLFTVMAAINAAGYSADLSSPLNHPLRDAIRTEISKRNVPSLPALKQFFEQHRQKNDVLELSQYISFALTASGPPDFEIKIRDVDVPPDVRAIQGLSPLLAAFYREAGIADLWKQSQPAIEDYLARYHGPVSQAVLQVNAYLRQQTSGFRGRHFQIFVELQAAPNQIQTRSYGDNYTIVITPSPEPRIFDVRHAYLHYLLDPLSTRYEEILDRKKTIASRAQDAPALDDSFKQDFLLLTTESLIKAIESKLDRRPEGVQEALRQGYILTPYFAEQLRVYEKQDQAMLYYYPAMVSGIDLQTEYTRLENVKFNREAPVHTVAVPAPPPPPPLTGAAKTLNDAEQLYTGRDLDQAKKLYLQVLEQTDVPAMHASAYYGLARIAALQKDPELAQRLFNKTLESQPEAQIKGWTLVYLGRLAIAAGDRAQANQYFQSAMKVEGASPAARQAASQGVESTSKP